ncbi:MAG: transglycosylase SLT domain-containing protein [Nannocystales bacterium]
MDGRTPLKLRVGSLGLWALMGLVLTASPSPSDAHEDSLVRGGQGSGPSDPNPAGSDGSQPSSTDAASGDPSLSAETPLVGLDGAATALAIRDVGVALQLCQGESGETGSDTWFRVEALRGRALRLASKPAEAVATLEPVWSHKHLRKSFPADALGMELARSQLAAADGLEPEAADTLRRDAAKVLGKVRKMSPIRNYAEVRVLEARAMAAIVGTDSKSTVLAGRKAVSALDRIIRDYPKHPDIGWLQLERAQAQVRAGKPTDAAVSLRALHIARAGEPEAKAAWEELESLAERFDRVRAKPLSVTEQLDRAMSARRLRWVDLSREILDDVIDTTTSKSLRTQARSSRAYTAYKQREFGQCADDLRPSFEATGSIDTRGRLLRCLERGAMYDEALQIYDDAAKSKKKWSRISALWDATMLAVRAGKYERAEGFLKRYEKETAGNRQTRVWLHAWLPMRLGRVDEAIAGFEAAERYSTDRTRARYFRAKLMLAGSDASARLEGEAMLTEIIDHSPLSYYALMARQRLLDAGRTVPPAPSLEPNRGEPVHPTRPEVAATLAELDGSFGDAWPEIRRARQLYNAGYLEEARRELRVAVQAYETRGKKAGGVRNESFLVGLGWKPDWSYPRIRPTRDGMRTLRSKEDSATLASGFRELARGFDEPYRFAKLSTSADGAYKARWHPRAFRAAVEREARHFEIDPIHMWSLMYTESRFRRFVVSPVGARGALQIMPWTAQQLAERLGEVEPGGSFDDDTLFDIDTNAHLAGYYVAELLKKFHGQAPMAYASYNGGPSNVQRWLEAKAKSEVPLERDVFVEEIAFRESYRYAKRVTEVSAAYALMYKGEFPRWTNEIDADVEDNIAF